MSVVVLQELIAGASDATAVKKYEASWKYYEQEGKLLVPTAEDWVIAGRILNALFRGLKSKNKGKTPKFADSEIQRIVRDVLIARCVKRAGAVLITDNLRDSTRFTDYAACRCRAEPSFLVVPLAIIRLNEPFQCAQRALSPAERSRNRRKASRGTVSDFIPDGAMHSSALLIRSRTRFYSEVSWKRADWERNYQQAWGDRKSRNGWSMP